MIITTPTTALALIVLQVIKWLTIHVFKQLNAIVDNFFQMDFALTFQLNALLFRKSMEHAQPVLSDTTLTEDYAPLLNIPS